MSLPIQANTTCDIYRTGTAPPAAPAVAGARCYLRADWRGGQENGDRTGLMLQQTWTHVLLLDTTVDIRDGYTGSLGHAAQDTVYVPDQNGTAFRVVFIERLNRGQSGDHKRVYLDRQAPTWPTNDV